MDNIMVDREQFDALNAAIKKVDALTNAMATTLATENVEIFNNLRARREDAVLDVRIVMMEQGLLVPPLKCSVVIPS